MNKTEQKLVDKGYQLKKTHNEKEIAVLHKKQYQAKGFKAQTVTKKENGLKVHKLYVKK